MIESSERLSRAAQGRPRPSGATAAGRLAALPSTVYSRNPNRNTSAGSVFRDTRILQTQTLQLIAMGFSLAATGDPRQHAIQGH